MGYLAVRGAAAGGGGSGGGGPKKQGAPARPSPLHRTADEIVAAAAAELRYGK